MLKYGTNLKLEWEQYCKKLTSGKVLNELIEAEGHEFVVLSDNGENSSSLGRMENGRN